MMSEEEAREAVSQIDTDADGRISLEDLNASLDRIKSEQKAQN